MINLQLRSFFLYPRNKWLFLINILLLQKMSASTEYALHHFIDKFSISLLIANTNLWYAKNTLLIKIYILCFVNFLFSFCQSLGIKGFKNPALAPLFITMTGGMIFVAAYCIRSLTGNIDVTWRKGVETPQDKWQGQQFKFMNPRGTDFSQFKPPTY